MVIKFQSGAESYLKWYKQRTLAVNRKWFTSRWCLSEHRNAAQYELIFQHFFLNSLQMSTTRQDVYQIVYYLLLSICSVRPTNIYGGTLLRRMFRFDLS